MKIRQVLGLVAVWVVLFVAVVSVVGVVNGFTQTDTSQFPRHPMGPPPAPAVCTDGKYLFVVMGPKIHLYSVPDLTLQNTVELPRPTPPSAVAK